MSEGVTVLIAYDGSPHADAAIDQAATLFPGAQAFVATAWRSIRPAAGGAHLALPADVIDEAVGKLDAADVIAVGSRGRSAVSSALLGSVSNALVHNADRPVLVVHAPSGGS